MKSRTITGLEDIRPMHPDGALARTMRAGRYWEKRARAAEQKHAAERRADAAALAAAILAGAVSSPVVGALGWLVYQWLAR